LQAEFELCVNKFDRISFLKVNCPSKGLEKFESNYDLFAKRAIVLRILVHISSYRGKQASLTLRNYSKRV